MKRPVGRIRSANDGDRSGQRAKPGENRQIKAGIAICID